MPIFTVSDFRVQQSEQIKFIDLNSNHCPKEDTGKETDIKFYLADGIGDFEQSINEEFIELYGKMGLQGYEPKVCITLSMAKVRCYSTLFATLQTSCHI